MLLHNFKLLHHYIQLSTEIRLQDVCSNNNNDTIKIVNNGLEGSSITLLKSLTHNVICFKLPIYTQVGFSIIQGKYCKNTPKI